MHRPGPGGDGGIAYGGPYGGGGYGGDELACALRGLALGGEHLPGSPYDAYALALPAMSPRAAGQDAYNDASAHADLLFDAQDVSWLRAAYGQGFDPERLMAGEAVPAEHARQPMSPGYHSLYKTELCRSYEETSTCRYGSKCQFAHGQDELRPVMRHPRYKTELCRTFATSGTCPYGTRCRFIHYRGAAPVASAPPGAGGAKLTVTVPPGSPRSPRVAPFLPAQPASPAESAGGAGPGSPPPSPKSPATLTRALVPEGAPRAAAAAAIHAGAATPESPPCTPPRSVAAGGGDEAGNNGSGSEDSGGRAKARSRLPIFQTLCTASGAIGGKELPAAAPASPAAAPAPGAGGGAAAAPPKSPKKKNGPTPKPPPPPPNRAAMQLRRGAVCE